MKFIDEKGRLFGKLNLIDLLITLLVIAGLVGVNYKLGLIKTMGAEQDTSKKAIVKVWVKKVSNYTADAIKASGQDILKDAKTNDSIGKIIDVQVGPAKDTAPDATGKWVLSEVPDQKEVFITMEALASPVNGNLKLGSKDAKVGSELIIKGTKFQTVSYIIGVE